MSENITINGMEYTPVGAATGDRKIVICTNGWVFVGSDTGDGVNYTNASVIRRWGTTKGLGQLALEGKTDKTVLDFFGSMTVCEQNVIAVIDVVDGVDL
jgi:hypothetical protein